MSVAPQEPMRPPAAGDRGEHELQLVPRPEAANMRWRTRLAGNLAWNVASDAAMRGTSLWMAFACARALPVSGFGRYAFALALTQYVWLAGDAAVNSAYATRELARARGAQEPGAAALGGLFWSARMLAALALSVVSGLALLAWPAPVEQKLAIGGAMIFFLTYSAFADWALRAAEDFRGLALANITGAVALVAGTLLVLPRFPTPAMAALLWSSSFACAALVATPRLLRRGVIARPQQGFMPAWRTHAGRSAVYSLGAVAAIGCAQSPVLLVGAFGDAQAVGLFASGYRLLIAMIGVFSVLWWPLFPILARSRPDSRTFIDALSSLTGMMFLVSVPATLALTLWPREILTALYGARYAGGADALRVGALALPLYTASGLFEQACLAVGGEAVRARVNLVALALMVGASAVLVPRYGSVGAAATLPMAFALNCVVYLVTLRRVLPKRAMAHGARGALLLSAALGVVWGVARVLAWPAIPVLITGGVLYAVLAFVFRLVPLPARFQPGAAS